uniref:DNA polymerase alpha subunit B n=1 Tax=Trichuris muris TaxID=70415 RepID=A0A5S6QDP3_TRIMR
MSSDVQMEEIRNELLLFGYRIPNDPVVMDKVIRICNEFHFNAEEFANEYVAFAYCSKVTTELNQDLLDMFVQQLDKPAAPKESDKSHQFLSTSNTSFEKPENVSDELLAAYGVQSTNPQPVARLGSVEPPTERILVQFGGSSKTEWIYGTTCRNVLVRPFDSSCCLNRTSRYMYQKNDDVSLLLSRKIEQFEQLMIKQLLPSDSYFSRLGTVSDESIYVCGQLFSEFSRFQGSPLDVSIQGALGDVTKLNLSQLANFSIFPGQVVAMQGVGKRGEFCATSIYAGVVPPAVEVDLSEAVDHLSLLIAAGPFISMSEINWQPLHDLVNICRRRNPDVLLLVGPFISEKCKIVENISQIAFEDCFNQAVSIISAALTDGRTIVVIVSSSQDVLAEPVFPCPPYPLASQCITPRTRLFCDPSILRIGGLTFAVTSADILRHLSAEEVFHGSSAAPRLDRILKHLLLQRSFYPLYPSAEELNLDVTSLARYGQLPVLPNFFIVPSDCQFFIKEINNCIFVNPGRCAKRTYSRLEVNINDQLDNADMRRHVAAEIVRF